MKIWLLGQVFDIHRQILSCLLTESKSLENIKKARNLARDALAGLRRQIRVLRAASTPLRGTLEIVTTQQQEKQQSLAVDWSGLEEELPQLGKKKKQVTKARARKGRVEEQLAPREKQHQMHKVRNEILSEPRIEDNREKERKRRRRLKEPGMGDKREKRLEQIRVPSKKYRERLKEPGKEERLEKIQEQRRAVYQRRKKAARTAAAAAVAAATSRATEHPQFTINFTNI